MSSSSNWSALGTIFMIWALLWGRCSMISSSFQSVDLGIMSSLTLRFWLCSVGGPMGDTCYSVESHLSLQTLIFSPFPTHQPILFLRTSRPTRIPFHPCDSEFGAQQVNRSVSRQYLLSKICPNREDGFLSSLQVCFARRASLNTSISMNPKPLALFRYVSLSQEIHLIFLNTGLTSHQKWVMTDCICLHKETGSLKHDIAYVGIAASTAFSKTIFPAPDKNLLVQLWACCLIRSAIEAKMFLFFRPKCSGRPRYFPIPPSLQMLSSLFTRVLQSWFILEENVITDFDRFMHCPEALSYLERIESNVAQLAVFDLPKSIVSSVNKRWFKGGQLRPTLTPGRVPFSRALLHKPERPSVHMMKR